jgi:hypothetical protein
MSQFLPAPIVHKVIRAEELAERQLRATSSRGCPKTWSSTTTWCGTRALLTTRLYVYSGKLTIAAMYLRRVGIKGRSYSALPTQVSAVVTPHAHAAQNLGVKKGGGGAETLPQQVINNSAAVQQER